MFIIIFQKNYHALRESNTRSEIGSTLHANSIDVVTHRDLDEVWILLTWLASMYSTRLYAAPAHAVSVMTPDVFTICFESGNIKNSLGRYCRMMLKRKTFFMWTIVEPFRLGMTIHSRNCHHEFKISSPKCKK